MSAGLVAIPALTFRTDDGRLDVETTARYARRAVATWLDAFILSGTTTEGDSFTVAERATVLDLWREVTDDPGRLIACSWEPADLDEATERGIRPLAVMRGLRDRAEACGFFADLPAQAYVYSHPMHTPTILDPLLIEHACRHGCLPAGAKISKIESGTIPALRRAAGPDFALWDGSSRRIAASISEGADGVVSTPLAALPEPFPARDARLQTTVDQWQAHLDAVPDQAERAAWLRTAAWRAAA